MTPHLSSCSLAAPTDPHATSVLERVACPCGSARCTCRTDHHVGEVDRGFLLDDAAGICWPARLRCRFTMLMRSTIARRCRAARAGPCRSCRAPGRRSPSPCRSSESAARIDRSSRPHSTSGASEMIFMNCFARSSRATGPKMRVPIGSPWLSMSTAEFVSKRMYEPSGSAVLLGRAHDDRLHDVALLHLRVRNRFLHGDDDHVAERGVLAPRSAEHLDAQNPARARVVGDVEYCFRWIMVRSTPVPTRLLRLPSRRSPHRQRLSRLSGRSRR